MAEKDNNRFIWLYHRYRSVKTVKDFMEREHIYNVEVNDFFELNRELIWQQYDELSKQEEKERAGAWPESATDLTADSFLPCPCNLKIQATKVTAELFISQTNFQSETGDFYAFASEQISNIIQNEGYRITDAVKKEPIARVYGWFKSMYFVHSIQGDNLSYTLNDDFFDISQFVINLSTLQTKEGGSFSMRLPIINLNKWANGVGSNEDDIVYSGTPNVDFESNDYRNLYSDNGEFYSKNVFGELESNYFNWLVSSNDLLFISFEKLEMEEESKDLNVKIANGVFDMIALVDEVKVVADSDGANGYVEVTGRDLMKLLIEDGSFFFNPSTSSDPSSIFMNEQSYGKQGDIREADQNNNTYNNPINRLRRVSGEIDIFVNRINMDLSFILKGVISQLSNVEVVPSFVFDAWGDERTTYADLQPQSKEKTREAQLNTAANGRLAPGIWQITKLLIDSSVSDKQVFDSGISTQTGSILNFFRKVCQEPLVEMMGDTFGSQYYWIVRRPPFDEDNLNRLMESANFVLNSNDIINTNLNWNNQEIFSWYRYVPYGDLLGIPEAQLFMPAVFFPEFASVWGSRPLAVESNYYNWAQSGRWNDDKTEQQNNGDRIIRNAVRDFKYLVESNAYNAFTRRGTITLLGDRRIKRGTLVTHTSGEIFYVDSVQNEYAVFDKQVVRTTTLSVSRGMYPEFVEGFVKNNKKYSYFNIIDFGDLDISQINSKNWKKQISKWKVDVDNFAFFMSKQQVFWSNIWLNREKK